MFRIRTIGLDSGTLRTWRVVAGSALLCLAAAMPAQAAFVADFTVDFNSLSNNANDAAIGSLLTSAFQAQGYAGTVTVSGAVASNSYTADGNAVGPVTTTNTGTPQHPHYVTTVSSYTLANMDPSGKGTFIQNNSEGIGGVADSNAIVMTFSAPIKLSNISFDYEIFPNINCQSSSCGTSNWPTINVTDTYDPNVSLSKTGNITTSGSNKNKIKNVNTTDVKVGDTITGSGIPAGTTVTHVTGTTITMSKNANKSLTGATFSFVEPDVTSQIFQRYANVPGSATNTGQIGTTAVAPCPSSTRNCGGTTTPPGASTYLYSPDSGPSTKETAPQLLGSSGIVALDVPAGGNVTTLTFNDWPATIAINHVTFDVPEPGSLILLGSGLLALGMLRRRKRV